MKITAIVVDDEQKLTESFTILLNKTGEEVNCVGTANTALDGIKLINTLHPHIVFLDINMPQHSGFDLLEAIDKKDFFIVFTTAYEEHAIQAIKHKAFDYLLKPIALDELKTCIQKIKKEIESAGRNPGNKPLHIQVPVKEGTLLIKQQEVVHVEASGSYSIIHTTDGKKHTVTKNLKAIEELLDATLFFRCHNSHIVNLQRVVKILKPEGSSVEMDNGNVVEVSRNKKDELQVKL